MLVADEFLGTLADEGVAERVETGDPLTVTVDDTERRRSRFRTTAEDGTELGVVVARELEDNDVLAAGDRLVVVSLEPVDAMVVDFTGVADPDRAAVTTALELGHAVGNRHWDLALEGDRAFLPVTDSRDRMEATVEPTLPAGATIGYEAVPPTTFDESSGGHGHSHEHGSGHSHGPDSGHTHGHDSGHTHGDGTGHAHRDGTGRVNEHGVRSIDPDRGDDDA